MKHPGDKDFDKSQRPDGLKFRVFTPPTFDIPDEWHEPPPAAPPIKHEPKVQIRLDNSGPSQKDIDTVVLHRPGRVIAMWIAAVAGFMMVGMGLFYFLRQGSVNHRQTPSGLVTPGPVPSNAEGPPRVLTPAITALTAMQLPEPPAASSSAPEVASPPPKATGAGRSPSKSIPSTSATSTQGNGPAPVIPAPPF